MSILVMTYTYIYTYIGKEELHTSGKIVKFLVEYQHKFIFKQAALTCTAKVIKYLYM